MSNTACTILGSAVLAVLLAGYLGQKYLPPPKPKIVGIDLGTTYSCIGVYQAVTGDINILEDKDQHKCIPSIVAFSGNDIVVGYKAAAQAEHNPANTIYDAKRFIGKHFSKDELESESPRYPFKLVADEYGMVHYALADQTQRREITPEYIGSRIINTLKLTAEANISVPVTKAVMSVPAEFNEEQRNYTRLAAKLAGIDVLRIINEPTAAALAYGLHKKEGVTNVLVVDLGGGTLDVSLLYIQGGMFSTQGMAGNNHLGGQDFNERLMQYLTKQIEKEFNQFLTDPEDLQLLRNAVEQAKLDLTNSKRTKIRMKLKSFRNKATVSEPVIFSHELTRQTFEEINQDLFSKVLDPIKVVLRDTELGPEDVNEVVLVGGSTRIPKVRQLIRDFFNMEPNVSVDPELAVASGVAIQAGILGGMWPLQVSALELPVRTKKVQVH